MLITLVGVPILAGTLLAARGLGWFDRVRANAFLTLDVIAPPLRPAGSGFLRWLFTPFRDAANWKASSYLLVMLPVGVVDFAVAVTIWSAALSALFLPAYAWAMPGGGPEIWKGTHVHGPWQVGLASLGGLLLMLAAPWIIRPFALLDGVLVRTLLGASARDARIEQLQETRARSVDAAVEERRRIERDLHDGAQHRLVSLGMDLDLALTSSMTTAGARDLVGGPTPRPSARSSSFASSYAGPSGRARRPRSRRCPLGACRPLAGPCGAQRPSARSASRVVEATAYFVVAEALTNIAKHAGATTASVDVCSTDGPLRHPGRRRRRRRRRRRPARASGVSPTASAAVDGTSRRLDVPRRHDRTAELPCAS